MSDRKYSRRRMLALAGAGLLGVAGYRRWYGMASNRHITGESDDSAFDPATLNTIADFIAAYFGVSLDDVDRAELIQRLTVSTTADSNWRVDFRHLADIADDLAQQQGETSFVTANQQARDEIVADMLPQGQSRRRRKVRQFLMLDHRETLRMQGSTIPHLVRLYRSSGVPWRRRGYTSWPGVGGSTFAYASQPATTGC